MQCSTDNVPCTGGLAQGVGDLQAGQWQALLQALPADWEEMAYRHGALVRRRGVRNAQGLLQLILAYAVGDYSLRQVGLWGTLSGVASISDVAILKRLRQSQHWLEALVAALLRERTSDDDGPAVRLCLVDATSICRPGRHGTTWRVHLRLNLAEMQTHSLTLTDVKAGEGLHHFALSPGEILIADRAYGYARSLTHLLTQPAGCVVRIRWTDLAHYQHQGQRFDLIAWLKRAFAQAPDVTQTVELQLRWQEQSFPLRLVACPLPNEQAARARQRIRRKAQKNQVNVTQESLFVAGFVLLVTNLAAAVWCGEQIAQLYRLRWQVELYFKRLKSIMHLDYLRAHDPQLAQVYLLGKLLAALLLDRLAHLFLACVPNWRTDLVRPLSLWRLTMLLWSSVTWLFTQPWLRLFHLADPLILRRYLCNSPRKRPQQDAFAQRLVRSLSVVNVLYSLC
jgi:hypothetical protein